LIQRWIWRNPRRRAHKLFRLAETEADGGRDLLRAAELTADPLLRRLYLKHATDEYHHAALFRERGAALLHEHSALTPLTFQGDWLTPGERGLDDLRIEKEGEESLLAFLHLSEKAAARRFLSYREVLEDDISTQHVFARILKDETFHTKYTLSQLTRVSPERHRWALWRARIGRLWKGYLRLAVGLADMLGTVILTLQYFLFLAPFAWLAKRGARRDPEGWTPRSGPRASSLTREY
jgi:hypothetical protein